MTFHLNGVAVQAYYTLPLPLAPPPRPAVQSYLCLAARGRRLAPGFSKSSWFGLLPLILLHSSVVIIHDYRLRTKE